MINQDVNNFTSKEYWEKYYHNKYTRENIVAACSKYDVFWDMLVKNSAATPANIIEIGGFPGRYLAYISSKYNLVPTCLDYNSNNENSKYCFEEMGVRDYKIINADFRKFIPQQQYDIVFSHGFIEHFNDYDDILDKHVELLKPGGTMMITVPNKRNLRYYYGLLLDKENLKIHNIKSIRKEVFINFAARNNLQLLSFNYYGGFPYQVHQKLNFFQNLIYKPVSAIFKKLGPLLEKYPNKYTCSLLICVVKKK